jgi:tetratricopeptide (TPR) repeat protein
MYCGISCAIAALLVPTTVQSPTADDIAATIARSWYECSRGAADEAVAACTRLLALDPQRNAVAYQYRGLTYHNRGDYDRAIADYDQAIWLDPKYAVAYRQAGLRPRDRRL